jgi:hypothetical protein
LDAEAIKNARDWNGLSIPIRQHLKDGCLQVGYWCHRSLANNIPDWNILAASFSVASALRVRTKPKILMALAWPVICSTAHIDLHRQYPTLRLPRVFQQSLYRGFS